MEITKHKKNKGQYNFQISKERLDNIGKDFLMVGQQHELKPEELCIVIKLMDNWMSEQLGVEVKESSLIEA